MRPWTVLDRRLLFERPWLRLRADRVRLPGGHELAEFHVVEVPDWTCAVCLTDDDQVVLVEQYRHGIEEVVLELPGGVIDAGETPEAAARREVLEETGFEAETWTLLGRCAQDPHRQTNYVHCFAATGARRVAEQQLDAAEHMAVRTLPRLDVLERARTGGLVHGIHLAALFWAREQGVL